MKRTAIIFLLTAVFSLKLHSSVPYFLIEPASDHKYFFYCKIYDQAEPQLYFIIYDPENNTKTTYNKEFFHKALMQPGYEDYGILMKVNSMNIDLKHNVIPYINPIAAVRLFYILENLDENLKVTDAFRTMDQQDTYRKRRWSPLDVSPHQLGLAIDIPPYYINDRGLVQELCSQLNIKYIVHGGRRNRHLHINDQSLWKQLSYNEVNMVSVSLCGQIPTDFCSELISMKQGSSTIRYNRSSHINSFHLNFESDKISSLTIKISDIYSNKAADIYCGVFEKGQTNLDIDMSFLKKGCYVIRVFNETTAIKTAYFPVN